MQEAHSNNSVDQLLRDLADLLVQERAALIRMNAAEIERTAARKSELEAELAQRRQQFNASHLAQVRVIQTELRHNLILLVHARDQIHSTLGIMTGRPLATDPFHKPAPASVRLDLRG